MMRELAIYHLSIDVFTYQLHVTTNVPKFLADLEIPLSSLLLCNVDFDSLIFVILYDILIVLQSCLSFLIAPFPRLKRFHRLDLFKFLYLDKLLPSRLQKELNSQ